MKSFLTLNTLNSFRRSCVGYRNGFFSITRNITRCALSSIIRCIFAAPPQHVMHRPLHLDYFDDLSIDTMELEIEFKEKWDAEIKRLTELSKKVQHLHVKCLYCRSQKLPISEASYDAWKAIVKNVGSSQGHWRDLGFFLEIPQDDLNYIEYSVNGDKTDTVLRLYMEKETATIDHVTDALIKMKRYDVLKAMEEPLMKITQHFFKGNTSTSDAGYHSRGSDSGYTIIKPKNIPNELPEVLRSRSFVDEEKEEEIEQKLEVEPVKEEQKPPRRSISPKHVEPVLVIQTNVPTLLLTFAEDGKDFVETIRERTKGWSEEDLEVQVLTLCEKRNEVQQNPQSVIKNMIEQASYIVPIVTEGYLECISSKEQSIPSSTDHLDIRYARYIFTQLMHNYIFVDGCFNKKVRCVIPSSVDRSIIMKLTPYSVLIPWTGEAHFDEIFKDLVKIAKK